MSFTYDYTRILSGTPRPQRYFNHYGSQIPGLQTECFAFVNQFLSLSFIFYNMYIKSTLLLFLSSFAGTIRAAPVETETSPIDNVPNKVSVASFLEALVISNNTDLSSSFQLIDARQTLQYSGSMSFYNAANSGTCGGPPITETSHTVALSRLFFINSPSSYCGRTITISYQGKTTTAKVQDECRGCGPYDMQVAQTVFLQLAPLSAANINVQWGFN